MSFVERSGRNTWRVRYWRDDGTHATISGFSTKAAAQVRAREIDADRHRGQFFDPNSGNLTLAEWIPTWLEALDVAPTTEAQYRSLISTHIVPRWGTTSLNKISGIAVAAWTKKLRVTPRPGHAAGYARSTVSTISKVLTMLLADAVDEQLIPTNPIRPRRRGRTRHEPVTEAVWATPTQALHVAVNAGRLAGSGAGVLILTAAWTGARWGELTGLHRDNLHLPAPGNPTEPGRIVIDPREGALHEVGRDLYLGPPKTAESARDIELPPFLTELLREHLRGHRHDHVFVAADGAFHRRSNFSRRAMRPAADGTIHLPSPTTAVAPARPGLTFHGLRHSHKTWMIADHIPEAAQAARLGHRLPDKIQQVYSHVAPELRAHLLVCLQRRWTDALVSHETTPPVTPPGPRPGLVLPAAAEPGDSDHRAAS